MDNFELALITNVFGGEHRKTFHNTKEPIDVVRCNCGVRGWAKKDTEGVL